MTESHSAPNVDGDAAATIEIVAAIAHAPGEPFTLEAARIQKPRPDEVLVRLVATGMCHTDLSARDAELPTPLPAVLGHEGAGVVVDVGRHVDHVQPGDHVVLTYLHCGSCTACLAGEPASCASLGSLCFAGARPDGSHAITFADGGIVNDRFFGQSSFANLAVAHRSNVIPVRKDAPLELLGPLGCGVMTGAGAVWNALNLKPGSSFAVFGAGAVGLSAAMAARVSGATTIVCVDRVRSRLELARELGATHVVNASEEADVAAAVRSAAPLGIDAALDTTGRGDVILTALRSLAQRGALALVAISGAGGDHQIDMVEMIMGCKRVMGVVEGGSAARTMIPKLIDLYLAGLFPFDKLTRFYQFDEINEAAADSLSGKVIKPILRMRESTGA